MRVIEMINTLNANRNVVRVRIELSIVHRWNSEIIKLIISRYTNVY